MSMYLFSSRIFWIECILLSSIRCRLLPPKLWRAEYNKPGHINIGFLVDIYKKGSPDDTNVCSQEPIPESLQAAAAIEFSISEVNSREDLLPNITLGYVIKDSCENDISALSRSLFLIEDHIPQTCGERDGIDAGSRQADRLPIHRKVAGIVAHITSRQAVMVAPLMSAFQVPLLGTMATSDELTDKTRFEYFLNLLPPDTVTVKAMMDLLKHFGWSYVSVVYSDGSYGEFGFKAIKRMAKENGICIASESRVPIKATTDDYDTVIATLNAHEKAKTVIVFGEFLSMLQFFGHINQKVNRLDKVFIGGSSTCAYDSFPFVSDAVDGLICVGYEFRYPEGFVNFFNDIQPYNRNIPFLREVYGYLNNCSFDVGSSSKCDNKTKLETEGTMGDFIADKLYEGVYTFAHALNNLIQNKCPEINGNVENVDQVSRCLEGPDLLKSLKDSSFEGLTSTIEFNELGQLKARYLVKQIVKERDGQSVLNIVGQWTEGKNSGNLLTLYEGALAPWGDFLSASVTNYTQAEANDNVPESVCSQPCRKKQYRIRLEQICCWNCHDCLSNQVLAKNKTGCEDCPLFSWPDEETGKVCQPVQPTHLSFGDAVANGISTLAGIGLVFTIGLAVIFILHRNTRLVKASSKHIMSLMLCGAGLACGVTLSFITEPSKVICGIRHIGFHSAVNLIYGPLFVKTLRIYRIFSAGKKGNSKPLLISNSWQMIFIALTSTIQVVILMIQLLLYPPDTQLLMPVKTGKYVEITCRSNLPFFLLPLLYNILLIFLCAAMGIFVRKLPENFNESWFIFISVFTTIFTWVVFLPSYFMAVYSYYQSIILSLCLQINVYVTLLGLFCPKAYALYFVDLDQQNVKESTGSTKTTGTRTQVIHLAPPSRVHPIERESQP